nr:formyltransferase family protein [Roseomonas acroporae]
MLPYLFVNFSLPRLAAALRRAEAPLPALCRARGIPLVEVAEVNGPAMRDAIRAARPDLLVSFHFDQILSAATLALAPLGGVNLHPSLLPRHRGPIPAFWALWEGAMRGEPPAFGVTAHRLVPRIDAGAVLAQRAVALPAGVSASGAARLLHLAGVAVLDEALAALRQGRGEGEAPAPLPYCPFPDAATLRQAARRGVRLVNRADWRDALAALAPATPG